MYSKALRRALCKEGVVAELVDFLGDPKQTTYVESPVTVAAAAALRALEGGSSATRREMRVAGAVPLLLRMLADTADAPVRRESSRHALFLLQAMAYSSAEVRRALVELGGLDTLAALLVAQHRAAGARLQRAPDDSNPNLRDGCLN
jgi:hypothetical protein